VNPRCEYCTLLRGRHGIAHVPYADHNAAIEIMDIMSEPLALQSHERFVGHGRLMRLRILLPDARPQCPPGYMQHPSGSSGAMRGRERRAAQEAGAP
jgi:hypothetical protein